MRRTQALLLLGWCQLAMTAMLSADEVQPHASPANSPPPAADASWKPAQVAPAAIAWRQNTFAIPFRVNRPENADDAPVEMRLFVSVDQGRDWQFVQSAQPQVGRFMFRAPQDGTYWFSLRTVDRQGRMIPDAPHQPELAVTIDTLPPRLDLAAQRGASGQVELNWQAVDPQLSAETLRIQYQTQPNGPWQPLAVGPVSDDPTRGTLVGKFAWWPTERSGQIALRAEIADRAGNRTVSQAQVLLTAPAANVAAQVPNAGLSGTPNQPERFSQQIIPPTGITPGATGYAWPTDQVASRPLSAANTDGSLAQSPGGSTRDPFHGAAPRRLFDPPSTATTPNVYRPVSRPLPSPSDAPPSNSAAGDAPRMVNARVFELQYDVEQVGPAGLAKVELWGTRDRGQTWTLSAVDEDNRSPVQVEVDADGLYGFAIVVQSSNGLGGRPPQSGDQPEVWVGIDRTQPTAKLISALPGTGNQADQLIVTWEAADEDLDPRPITLSYATDAGGPWAIVAAGLENTGLYAWRLDTSVPDRLYLQLEARDRAGNVAQHYSPPIELNRPRPQGRIRGVRPIE